MITYFLFWDSKHDHNCLSFTRMVLLSKELSRNTQMLHFYAFFWSAYQNDIRIGLAKKKGPGGTQGVLCWNYFHTSYKYWFYSHYFSKDIVPILWPFSPSKIINRLKIEIKKIKIKYKQIFYILLKDSLVCL